MDYDTEKVDDAALALLFLNTHRSGPSVRAWKALAWEITDRLYEKGMIEDPVSKAKSVVLTKEGQERSAELFKSLFALEE